jgi:uncharacterized protein
MSNTKQLVESIYPAFTRGNLQYVVDLCSEDIVWTGYFGWTELPFMGDFKGKAGVLAFFNSFRLVCKVVTYEWNEFVVDGDLAVVLGLAELQVKSTSKTFVHPWCHVYTFKDGKIERFRGFTGNPSGMALAFNLISESTSPSLAV